MKLDRNKTNSGQAIIIILLLVAVSLTVGISLISRSVTDVRISKQEEEQARAFSVAEAGIEKSIGIGITAPLRESFGDGEFYVTATNVGGERAFVFPGKPEEGEVQTVWLIDHDLATGDPDPSGWYQGDEVKLHWGNEDQTNGQGDTPALEVTLFYEDNNDFKVSRGAFDPYGGRIPPNSFTTASDTLHSLEADGVTYQFPFEATFSLPTGGGIVPYVLRLKLIYNSDGQTVGVEGVGNNIPDQGVRYDSSATVGQGDDRATSRVEQTQLFRAPPGIFDYVLFSESDLSH